MRRKFKYKDTKFEILNSNRKNKQLMAIFDSGKKVHFGDPKMPEFPGTKRGDNYCARSSGIKGKDNPMSANFLSRKILWKCKGKKSMNTFKEAGIDRQ